MDESAKESSPPVSGEGRGQASGAGGIRPLRTYRSDAEELVARGRVSVVGIAAREMERARAAPREESGRGGLRIAYIAAGVILLLAGIGAGGLVYVALGPGEAEGPPRRVSLIPAERAEPVALPGGKPELALPALAAAKDSLPLALGNVAELIPEEGGVSLSAGEFLSWIGARAPARLLRTLGPAFMLGVHAFNGNQPFLIFTTDSYEQAFAGMIAWEESMSADLAPLFGPPIALTSGTATPAAVFESRVLRNRDVRVLPRGGGIGLLYAFPDRRTILITTNENTFAEAVTRLATARLAP